MKIFRKRLSCIGGTSLVVILPKALVDELKLSRSTEIEIATDSHGRIVVTPITGRQVSDSEPWPSLPWKKNREVA